MPNIVEVKAAVKRLIALGLDQAIKKLDEVLDPASSFYNAFIQTKSRYSAYLSNVMLNLASSQELNQQYAQLAQSLLILTDGLQQHDLKPEGAPAEPNAVRRGELLYNIPRQMQEHTDHRCRVRVAYLEAYLKTDWEGKPDDVQRSIRVAEVMSVELFNSDESEPFLIKPLNNPVQFLDETDYTEWVFIVKPRQIGAFDLALRVSVIEVRNGREVKKDVVLEQHVVVAADAPEPDESFEPGGINLNFSEPDIKNSNPPKSPFPTNPKSVYSEPSDDYLAESATPDSPKYSAPKKKSSAQGLRAVAFFLAFLVLGSGGAWAFTPPPVRDWLVTRYIQDTDQAYQAYIEKYKDQNISQLEDAYYRLAELNPSLANLRAYERAYPEGKARTAMRTRIVRRINTLEQENARQLEINPTANGVLRYIDDFPEGENINKLAHLIKTRPELAKEMVPILEKELTESEPARVAKLETFIENLPQERLTELKQRVDQSAPEAQAKAVPVLEKVYIKAVKQNPERAKQYFEDFKPEQIQEQQLESVKQSIKQKPQLEQELQPAVQKVTRHKTGLKTVPRTQETRRLNDSNTLRQHKSVN